MSASGASKPRETIRDVGALGDEAAGEHPRSRRLRIDGAASSHRAFVRRRIAEIRSGSFCQHGGDDEQAGAHAGGDGRRDPLHRRRARLTRRPAPATPSFPRTLDGDFLDEPWPADAVLQLLAEAGDVGATRTTGGRYFGFVTGGVEPIALAASTLAGAWDQNAALPGDVTARRPSSTRSPPAGSSSCSSCRSESVASFCAGATVANLTGIITGRDELLARAGWDVRDTGPRRLAADHRRHRRRGPRLGPEGAPARRLRQRADRPCAHRRMRPDSRRVVARHHRSDAGRAAGRQRQHRPQRPVRRHHPQPRPRADVGARRRRVRAVGQAGARHAATPSPASRPPTRGRPTPTSGSTHRTTAGSSICRDGAALSRAMTMSAAYVAEHRRARADEPRHPDVASGTGDPGLGDPRHARPRRRRATSSSAPAGSPSGWRERLADERRRDPRPRRPQPGPGGVRRRRHDRRRDRRRPTRRHVLDGRHRLARAARDAHQRQRQLDHRARHRRLRRRRPAGLATIAPDRSSSGLDDREHRLERVEMAEHRAERGRVTVAPRSVPSPIAASIVVEFVLELEQHDRDPSVRHGVRAHHAGPAAHEIARFDSATVQSPANGATPPNPQMHRRRQPADLLRPQPHRDGVEQLLDRHRRRASRASSRRCRGGCPCRSSCAPHRNALRNVADSLW